MLTKEHEVAKILTHAHGISRNNLDLVSIPKNINKKLVM